MHLAQYKALQGLPSDADEAVQAATAGVHGHGACAASHIGRHHRIASTHQRHACPAILLPAAFAGHAALSALFPWRFAKLDKAIKSSLEGLTDEQKKEAEAAGRAAALETAKLL